MTKNSRRPPAPLRLDAQDVVSWASPLWRLHNVAGAHPLAWNQLRHYGPSKDMRWDPHPPPAGHHAPFGVSYTSADATTAFAEVFQRRRAITLSACKALAGWVPTRSLSLLDIRTTWGVKNHASASLHAAPKSTCRAWASAVAQTWPDLDGLVAPSTITGSPVVVLFTPAADSFPARPSLARRLDDPAVAPVVVAASRALGWPIR